MGLDIVARLDEETKQWICCQCNPPGIKTTFKLTRPNVSEMLIHLAVIHNVRLDNIYLNNLRTARILYRIPEGPEK